MDEYIDREAAIKAIEFNKGVGCSDRCVQGIKYIPAADVVEVVRCKDCDFWWYVPKLEKWEKGEKSGACRWWSGNAIVRSTRAEDYCSRGVRKEDKV